MPVAEDLLGVRFDTQMLAKLALSVAGVLLVSWAYRFYNSRRRHARRDGPETQQPNQAPDRWEGNSGTSSVGLPDRIEEEVLQPDEVSCRETVLTHRKHSPLKLSSIPPPGEKPLVQHLYSPGEPLHIQSDGETLSEQYDDSPQKPQNVLSPGEMFADKDKCSSTEAQRSYLANVEPDVTIVRGDENLNHESSLPTTESMVQHDPPRIKWTPVAHDHSSQGPLHTNGSETEGQLDVDLALDSSLPPSPTEDLDKFGVSSTGRHSPYKLEGLEPSGTIDRELKQDLGHLGNSSHFISEMEIIMQGRQSDEAARDGAAPVEAQGRICDNHEESLLQSVTDENLLPPASILKPTGELDEASLSFDPLSLKQPELSWNHSDTKAIDPLRPSFTPPLSLQDPVLPTVQEQIDTDDLGPPSPEWQGPVRKNSYMHIVENDLQIPLLDPTASAPQSMPSSLTPSSEDSTIDSRDNSGGTGLEGVERMSSPGSSPELERLQGRLDLGNCLHALSLAKKEGHAGLQHAALKVMSDNYLQVLQDPGIYGSLKGGDRDLIRNLRMRGKKCLVVADLDQQDWAGSESSLPKTSSSLYYYDNHKDSWNVLCSLPKEVVSRGSSVCVMDNYLFVTLGCQGSGHDVQLSRRAFCYNPATSIWKEISPMNEARPQCKLVALGGYVYAIGGECLSSVERYDPRTGRWAFVAPMPNDTFAVAHRATACNGELFVSGGTLKYTLLRYNPDTNIWRRSLIVGTKERTIEMVAVKNFLYRFDVGSTSGVSVYRYHVAARLWYECCSRKIPECTAFQCAVIDDIIYCVSRQATFRFRAHEVSPNFIAEDLSNLSVAKGSLLPFVLVLPETEALQTSV